MEMSKLEKVIKEWETVLSRDPLDAPWDLIDDTLALLKVQEAQKFFVDESGKITPLPVVVRCKDCIYRGNSEKCVLSAISEEKDFPLFMLDNRGEWFCADGERKGT